MISFFNFSYQYNYYKIISQKLMNKKRKQQEQSDEQDSEQQQQKKAPKNPKPKFIKNSNKSLTSNRIIMNISDCQYPVVRLVGKLLKWKIQTDPQNAEWDMWWTDNAVLPQILFKMQQHQKINHFPGMYILARKNLLGKGLMKMKKQFPDQYNFFPLTWMLPSEFSEFRLYYQSKPKGKARTYIVKPEALSQGKGIFLTRKIEDLQPGAHYVVQRYLHKPYLIDGLKFDFRIYVLLAGVDPLRVYLYNQGLARFATQTYIVPTKQNMEDVCMHLTNYAINKDNPNFIFNQSQKDMSVGHKRSLTSVFQLLEKSGLNTLELKQKIKDILIKTFISGLPSIRHQYRSCQPENYSGNMCFQVLGFDILLTHKGDPYLLEVNHTPSFTTDTPLDQLIKKNLIRDTLILMNINPKTKAQVIQSRKQACNQRVITGKKIKLTNQQKQNMRMQAQKLRDQYQNANLGGFQKIYPVNDEKRDLQYTKMMEHSEKLYSDSTGIKKKTVIIKQKITLDVKKSVPKNINPTSRIISQLNKLKLEEKQDTKISKQDSNSFLPSIKTTNETTKEKIDFPSSNLSKGKSQSVKQKDEDRVTERQIIQNINQNFGGEFKKLKQSIKKKQKLNQKQFTNDVEHSQDQKPPTNQVNFSFFINQIKIDASLEKKKTLNSKKRNEYSNLITKNMIKMNKAISVQNTYKAPISLNTLLNENLQNMKGAASISNLKQIINKKRQKV